MDPNIGHGPDKPPGDARPTRRVSIYLQLLIPMILLVFFTSLGATSVTALWIARGIQRQQAAQVDRIVQTLTHSSYPLTRAVLQQIRGFSGADFVLLDADQKIVETTLDPEQVHPEGLLGSAERRQTIRIGTTHPGGTGVEYVVDRVDLPARKSPDEVHSLLILREARSLSRQFTDVVYPALTVGVSSMLMATAVAGWIARRLVAPIRRVADHAAVIARAEFRPLGLPERGDELGDLARSIDTMALRLEEYSRRIREIERLETLSRIGASMAHQLRNSATGGRMAVELHRRDCPLGEDDALHVAVRQFQRMESHLRQFLSYGEHPANRKPQPVDLAGLTRSTITLLKPMAAHSQVQWTIHLPDKPFWIAGDRSGLEQLVMNLLVNAMDAVTASRRLPREIHVRLADRSEREGVLEIEDSGDGLAEDILPNVFRPFNTNKPDGVGLGLFVAQKIAKEHRGTIAYDRTDKTTRFRFTFPLRDAAT